MNDRIQIPDEYKLKNLATGRSIYSEKFASTKCSGKFEFLDGYSILFRKITSLRTSKNLFAFQNLHRARKTRISLSHLEISNGSLSKVNEHCHFIKIQDVDKQEYKTNLCFID